MPAIPMPAGDHEQSVAEEHHAEPNPQKKQTALAIFRQKRKNHSREIRRASALGERKKSERLDDQTNSRERGENENDLLEGTLRDDADELASGHDAESDG